MRKEIEIIEHLQLGGGDEDLRLEMQEIEDVKKIMNDKYLNIININTAEDESMILNSYSIDINEAPREEFDISPLDFCQGASGVLIRKDTGSDELKRFRLKKYNFLKNLFGETWMNQLFSIINGGSLFGDYYYFCIENGSDDIVEKIEIFSLIELELIGNKYLSESIFQNFIKNYPSYQNIKDLCNFYYKKDHFHRAYKLMALTIGTKELYGDKEFLRLAIELNALNDDKGSDELVKVYGLSISEKFLSGLINEDEFNDDQSFYYERLINLNIIESGDINEIINIAKLAIEVGNTDVYYYLIHAYIVKKDYKSASKYYKEWGSDDSNKISFNNENEIEDFYLEGYDLEFESSTELLVNFYREQAKINGFNNKYFDEFIKIIKSGDYNFTDEDMVFFEEFNLFIDSFDNKKNIKELITILFGKYEELKFSLYADKIFFFISKYLRGVYGDDIKIKKTITYWLERFSLTDEFIGKNPLDLNTFKNELNNRSFLLEDTIILEERFKILLIQFSRYNLDATLGEDVYNDINIGLHDDYISLPSSLASIFDFYGLHDEKNKALSFDTFFQNNKLRINKGKSKKNKLLNRLN